MKAVNQTENELTTTQSEMMNSYRNSVNVKSTGIKLMTAEDIEHQNLLEMRKGINVINNSKREPMKVPSYEDEEHELNQVSPDPNTCYLNMPIAVV